MAIVKNPKRYQSDKGSERAAEQFIAAAGTTAAAVAEPAAQTRKTPIMVRFDPGLLKRVDTAAKHRGISRSSWIQYVISKALDEGEG